MVIYITIFCPQLRSRQGVLLMEFIKVFWDAYVIVALCMQSLHPIDLKFTKFHTNFHPLFAPISIPLGGKINASSCLGYALIDHYVSQPVSHLCCRAIHKRSKKTGLRNLKTQ